MYQDPAETSPQFSTMSFKEFQDFDNLLIFQIVEELLQETSFVMINQSERAPSTM